MRGIQVRITDGIGRQIIGGRYAPGDLLPKEAELTEQFGVSRTSVREGMRVLAAKGLVDIRQKIGTTVRQPEHWNVFDSDILRWHSEVGRGDEIMRNLVEVRELLEPAAARLAADRASAEDRRRISDALSVMVAEADDPDGYARADAQFHQSIYAASHNLLLRQFGTVVADVTTCANDATIHTDVLAAIADGEGGRAAESMLRIVREGTSIGALLSVAAGE